MDWITVRQAAKILRVTERAVLYMIGRGELEARRLNPDLPNSPQLVSSKQVNSLQKKRAQSLKD